VTVHTRQFMSSAPTNTRRRFSREASTLEPRSTPSCGHQARQLVSLNPPITATGRTEKMVSAVSGGVNSKRSTRSFLLGVCEHVTEAQPGITAARGDMQPYELALGPALGLEVRVPEVQQRPCHSAPRMRSIRWLEAARRVVSII
jgi:hypothetical protein